MRLLTRMVAALATAGLLLIAGLTAFSPPASAATLTEVTNFGQNPSNLRMFLYVPDRLAQPPAVVVAMHYCTGSAQAMYTGTQFASLADRYGYIVIYPEVTRSSRCFDVSSAATLQHNGGSDSLGIVSMVRYVLQRYNADSNRVFATGISSGAMMTNVLLGAYPDVFRAGAAFAGVPFGCFATTSGEWNSDCANGRIVRTPQQWGDLVRAAYPGYNGPRPRMQLWHGTNDEILSYVNFQEAIKQWTNVLGVSQTPTSTDYPQPNWTRTRYADSAGVVQVEAISMQGVTHNLPVSAADAIRFFGLDGSGGPTGGPTTSPPVTSSPPTSPSLPGGSDSCRVSYTMNTWNTGFTAAITITNTSSTPVNGWALTFTLPSGQNIVSGWNATYSPSSGAITARNVSYNASVPPGASVDIGFQATHTGNTSEPTAFQFNGANCTVV